MADTSPQPTDYPYDDRGTILLAVTGLIFSLAMVCYCARMYVRLFVLRYPWWDDWLMTVASVFATVEYALLVAKVESERASFSSPTKENEGLSARLTFFNLLMWAWTVTSVKISVALMLLRIKYTRPWRIALRTLIVSQIIIAVVNCFLDSFQCRPYYALYSAETFDANCWSTTVRDSMTYVISAFFIASDIICSLLPVWLIYKVSRPRFEKIVFICLMSLGLFASGAGVAKLVLTVRFANDPTTVQPVKVFIWTHVEECVGIMAGSIPVLKAPLDRLLAHFGIYASTDRSGRTSRRYGVTSISHGQHSGIYMGEFSHPRSSDWPRRGSGPEDRLSEEIPLHDRKISQVVTHITGG